MRRLVADLLLLARADAGREPIRTAPSTCPTSSPPPPSELEPVAGDHEISISAAPGAEIEGVQDELHRLVLNLMENALRHTDPGTAVEATRRAPQRPRRARGRGRRAGNPAGAAARRSSSASSARTAIARGSSGLGLAIVQGGRREPPRARSRSSRRSTGAEPASSCASRPQARTSQALKPRPLRPMLRGTCLTSLPSSSSSSRSASEEYALPIGVGPRDHPLLRASLGRLRRAVDSRRHRPARQDHPDLRPRLAHRHRRRRRRVRQDRHRRDRHRPGRRRRRRRRRGPDRHGRAARGRPDRRHRRRSSRSPRSATAS